MTGPFATGDGATAAVEAFAEMLCFLNRHRHTVATPACAASRMHADAMLALLAANRERSFAVGEWLMDQGMAQLVKAIERAAL